MDKIEISLKEIYNMRSEILAKWATSSDDRFILFIKEFRGYLKRKGLLTDIEIEEETSYETNE